MVSFHFGKNTPIQGLSQGIYSFRRYFQKCLFLVLMDLTKNQDLRFNPQPWQQIFQPRITKKINSEGNSNPQRLL